LFFEGTVGSDKNEIIKFFLKKARSIENDMYTRTYRREMIRVYIEKSFEELSLKN